MLEVKKHGIVLQKSEKPFENKGVLNPGCYQEGDSVHMFYRAVDKNNISTIGYCRLDGPLEVGERSTQPVIVPENSYEIQGVEDPRIVKIDDTFFLTYTAYDGKNAMGAVATSRDMKTFTKKGIITPGINYVKFKEFLERHQIKFKVELNPKYLKWFHIYREINLLTEDRYVRDKDVIFFPKRIQNKYAFLHRIYPGIQIVYVNSIQDLTTKFWLNYFHNFSEFMVCDPKHEHEIAYIGGGCPPPETEAGWLLIYHSVSYTHEGKVYHASAALLDKDDPTIEIARLKDPLFSPTRDWEISGTIKDVVFPTGTALFDDELYIYYGAADQCIAAASVKLSELLEALKSQP